MTPTQPVPARDRREDIIEHARAALNHARRTIEVAFRANAPDWCDPNEHTTIKEIDRVLAEIAALNAPLADPGTHGGIENRWTRTR